MCDLGEPKAFILRDIQFYTASKLHLPTEYAIAHPEAVAFVKVTFRWQKNKRHGIFRWMSRNRNRPYLCAVSAWIEIVA